MTLFNSRKQKLINELQNKEYRDSFVSEHISTGIPFQIKALREQREWTQKELGKRTNKHQEIISQLEDPDYGRFTIGTLKKLASAFDVGLVVRFVPFGELAEWELNLSSNSLKVPSFDEEKYFQEKDLSAEIAISDQSKHTTDITRASSNFTSYEQFMAKREEVSARLEQLAISA